jgi:hypothetical protein
MKKDWRLSVANLTKKNQKGRWAQQRRASRFNTSCHATRIRTTGDATKGHAGTRFRVRASSALPGRLLIVRRPVLIGHALATQWPGPPA